MQINGKWLKVAAAPAGALLLIAACSNGKTTTIGQVEVDCTRSMLLDADSSLVLLVPEQRIVVDVNASANLESSGQWVYTYRLTSDETSTNDVDGFALMPVQAETPVVTPQHWGHNFCNQPGKESALVWFVSDMGTLPNGWVDTGNIPPSEFDLQPGQAIAGFEFRSPYPPAPQALRFFVTGFDTLRSYEGEGDYDPDPSMFEEGVTGLILGPSGPYGSLGSAVRPLALGEPWPDTLRAFTIVDFALDREVDFALDVLDESGRISHRLARGRRGAGSYAQTWYGWDRLGKRVPGGRYSFRLSVDGREVNRRGIVVAGHKQD